MSAAAMRGIAPKRELNLNFKVVKLLGKGSYGSVYQVQRLGDGKTYALKEMDVRTMNQAEREDSVNEVRLLASVAHPNVISYNEAFLDGNRLCIIMEYAPDGDLAKVIKKFTSLRSPLPEDLIWKYFIQIARGLAALHNMKILHRDIKPGNIMIMDNDVAKIGDLGIAKLLRHTMAKTQIGTPHYMPPEIWHNKPYSFTSDSWAMGCLMYEMATLKVPFEAKSMNELKSKVMRGSYPPIPSTFSRDLLQMVGQCLDQNPDRRPTMDDILCSRAVQSRMHLVSDINGSGLKSPSTAGSGLLATIKVPRNFQMLKGKLPPAVYDSEQQRFGAVSEEEERDHLPPLGGGNVPSNAYVRKVEALPPKSVQAGHQYADAPQISDAMMFPKKNPAPAHSEVGSQMEPHPKVYGSPPMQQPLANISPPSVYAPPTPSYGPPPSAYEVNRKAQQRGAYLNDDNSPWYPQQNKPVAPKISESHAAYGAFYYSPKGPPPMSKPVQNPIWAAADMFKQYTPAARQAQDAPGQQQQAYRGYYNPYASPEAGQKRAMYQQAVPQQPKKLPSLAQQRQAAAMERLAYGGRKQEPAPAWNFGGGGAGVRYQGRNAGQQAGGGQSENGGGNQPAIARYPPMQWQAPKAGRW